MMKKTFHLYQVDAFTRQPFTGNPAGVVTNADGLTAAQMQSIAREMNDSETAFILAPEGQDHDVHLRFFTPTCEVPVCGHATIASHFVRAKELNLPKTTVIQKCGAGNLPIEICPEGGTYKIIMTQGALKLGEPWPQPLVQRLLAALGLTAGDLREDCPVLIASTGNPKVMVGIKDLARLHALQPDLAALKALSGEIKCTGYFIFTLHPGQDPLVHGRMFAPAGGVPEDPVTGNANGPLGGYLVQYGLLPREGAACAFNVVQGEAMGRPGGMRVLVDLDKGRPVRIRLAGEAVAVFKTELELECV